MVVHGMNIHSITKLMDQFTLGNSVISILCPLFDFKNDFTSPLIIYGNTIIGMDSSGEILTPMRLSTLG